MIVINKEMAFISLYLAEKEFFVNETLRKALNCIYYLHRKKNVDKALAIHLTNEKYKKKYNVEYTKDYLWKMYNSRLAHIKNAKDKFQIWAREIRERRYGILPDLCECGCGKEVKKNNKFVNGHNAKCRSKEENESLATNMRSAREINKSATVISLSDRIPKKP